MAVSARAFTLASSDAKVYRDVFLAYVPTKMEKQMHILWLMHILVRVLLQILWLMQEGVQQAQSTMTQV